ncbi:MAG: hypothetical protein II451_05600, partial [Oscillospiraceae bacterium]|nr:hypothetical protein [Oscillospiraceae bacterium]
DPVCVLCKKDTLGPGKRFQCAQTVGLRVGSLFLRGAPRDPSVAGRSKFFDYQHHSNRFPPCQAQIPIFHAQIATWYEKYGAADGIFGHAAKGKFVDKGCCRMIYSQKRNELYPRSSIVGKIAQ